jgi:hypothetical protein
MVQWGFEVWHFVDLLWWWALTLVLGRLSRDTLRPGWQWLRASAAGLAVLAVGVAIATPLLLRGFPLGDVLAAGREMVAGLEPEAARGLAAGSGDVRRLLQSSVARHGVLVSPDLAGAIRNAFGARAVELVRRAAGPDGPRGLGVHVPPGNERFWRYAVDCRIQPMFLPALAGVPMVLGLPPSTSPCLFPRTYGYADYGPTSRSRDLGPSDLCRHARSQGLHRVFLLRDVDRPEANQLLRCDPSG